MYWILGPVDYDEHFSYLISKHPDNEYDRDIKGAHVYARFTDDKRCFEGNVVRDSLTYLKIARKRNDTNYLFPEADCVSPINITCFFDVLRSAANASFDGILKEGIVSQEEVETKKTYEITFGPWVCRDVDHVIQSFVSFGLGCEVISDPVLCGFDMKHAFMLRISGKETLPTFLQKIVLISHYLTYWLELNSRIPDERVEKYVRLGKSWINECSDEKIREDIIRKLSGRGLRLERFMKEQFSRSESEDKEIKDFFDNVAARWGELHRMKHEYIVALVKGYCKDKNLESPVILDWACGEGKLWKRLRQAGFKNVYGFDSSIRSPKMYRTTKIRQMNILVPRIGPEILSPDILICSEVIEHFDEKDRKIFLKIIRDVICPKYLIITTPNVDYNPLYGMEPGTFRHGKHKIEFTLEQFNDEVTAYLSSSYWGRYVALEPQKDVQQSLFVTYTQHKKSFDRKYAARLTRLYSYIYLPHSAQIIRDKELEAGYSSFAYQMNADNIFYLGATVAPAEYDPVYDKFLEHPRTAFEYYRKRGCMNVVVEEKKMGSRAYILVFRNDEVSRAFHGKEIIVNSRGGFPFFDVDDERILQIKNDIQAGLTKRGMDFVVLDAEIMPWMIKAERLVGDQFRLPGEARLMRNYYSQNDTENSQRFLAELDIFQNQTEFEVALFGLLAEGNVSLKRDRFVFSDYTLGMLLNQQQKHDILSDYCGDVVSSVSYMNINVSLEDSVVEGIEFWNNYCEKGGEGIVIKPYDQFSIQSNGYYLLPSMKARGSEYLRLIYGIDIYEPNYFDIVKYRRVRKKRMLSVLQTELGFVMLKAFLDGRVDIRHQTIGAFLGTERAFGDIDKTL